MEEHDVCIGPYRILDILGEGGMGRVYRAQELSTQRVVALKVLHAQAPRHFFERFRREAELLAALEHESIARIYAANVSAAGLAWIAMELVDGVDLVEYCRGRPLTECLQLLIRIVRALQYAHSRGVVHRDLKPSNILVTAAGWPKLLDFGVAYAIASDARQVTLNGQIIGTVAYMSPEQLLGDHCHIDQRVDIYALGVIAYQLIAGQLPYAGFDEALTTVGAIRIVSSAAPRRLGRLTPEARGDLETVVMKALAHDPGQRYRHAADFADDLSNVMQAQPISVRRPTIGYALGLLMRRHRAASVAVGLALLSMVAATAVSAHFALQARQRLGERVAINEFLQNMLLSVSPERSPGSVLSVKDLLDVARAELDAGEGTLPPAAELRLRHIIGQAYLNINGFEQARTQAERALQLARQHLPEHSPDYNRAMLDASVLAPASTAEQIAQLQTLNERLAGYPDPEIDDLILDVDARLAVLYDEQGLSERSIPLFESVLLRALDRYGASNDRYLLAAAGLGLAYHRDQRAEESLSLLERVIADAEQHSARNGLGLQRLRLIWVQVLSGLGRVAEAEPVARQILSSYQTVFGDAHLRTQTAKAILASILARRGQHEESLQLAAQAEHGVLAVLGPDDERSLEFTARRADALELAARHDEARLQWQALVQRVEQRVGGPRRSELYFYDRLSGVLEDIGDSPAALAVELRLLAHAETLAASDAADEVSARELAGYRCRAADLLLAQGLRTQAIDLFARCVPAHERALGGDDERSQYYRARWRQAEGDIGQVQQRMSTTAWVASAAD